MNVGSIFRLSDALGVEKIFLTGKTPIPPNRKISKTSMSTEKYVNYEYVRNANKVLSKLKQDGFTIIELEITLSSIDLRKVDYSKFEKICIVVGSENKGIKKSILNLSDYTVHIPMLGVNSSMNVAASCAIALFEIINNFRR